MNQTLASNYRLEALAVGAGDTRCCFKHREKRFIVCVRLSYLKQHDLCVFVDSYLIVLCKYTHLWGSIC